MVVDSTLLLMGIVFGFALMGFGHYTKIKLFNLFSVGVFIFLATQLAEFVPLLIVFIGLMIYELYYTFFGGDTQ